jgi:uncharacterized membrane protein
MLKVIRLKLLLVTMLLGTGLFSLIASIDYVLMGISANGIIAKAVNPFQVMENAEYLVLFIFFLFYIFDIVGAYLNKRKKSNPPSEKGQ